MEHTTLNKLLSLQSRLRLCLDPRTKSTVKDNNALCYNFPNKQLNVSKSRRTLDSVIDQRRVPGLGSVLELHRESVVFILGRVFAICLRQEKYHVTLGIPSRGEIYSNRREIPSLDPADYDVSTLLSICYRAWGLLVAGFVNQVSYYQLHKKERSLLELPDVRRAPAAKSGVQISPAFRHIFILFFYYCLLILQKCVAGNIQSFDSEIFRLHPPSSLHPSTPVLPTNLNKIILE